MTPAASGVKRMGRIVGLASALGMALTLGLGGTASADPVSSHGKAAAHSKAATAGPSSTAIKQQQTTPGGGKSSGPTTLPQPISNADANSGGANGQCPGGPYCSTRDGSPSHNGNGKGQAVGKPCAGCVGKADNKNPPGQMPNGSDPNAGYECDRNHGIGRTNPAHTGCIRTTTPPPPGPCVPSSTKPCTTPPGPCVPSSTKPCTTPPGPCVPSRTKPCTTPPGTCTGTVCGSPGNSAVLGIRIVREFPAAAPITTAAGLASTGGNISLLLEAGLILIGLGSIALFTTTRAGRRTA